jgi:hypothetical protein
MTEPILDPTGGRELAENAALAPRAGTLRGATIGLLSSSKHNSDALLRDVGELLRQRGAGRLVADTKPHFGAPVAEDQIASLKDAGCDVIVTAIGD